jgi:uncharacterized protein YifE (UPF0438 family)
MEDNTNDNQTPAWATDLAKVETEEWYTAIPEEIRPTVRGGLEARLKDYDKGYQGKYQSLAGERQAWAKEKQELQRQAQMFQDIFSGDEDPRVAESQTKLAELEAQLESLKAERDDYKGKWDSHEAESLDKEADRVIEQYKDILEHLDENGDQKAFKKFAALLSGGEFGEAEAAEIVRSKYMPKVDAPKELSKSLSLASTGKGPSTSNHEIDDGNMSVEQLLRRSAERNARRLNEDN